MSWLRRKSDGSDVASVVVGCVDGRIAVFSVAGDLLGVITTGEVIRYEHARGYPMGAVASWCLPWVDLPAPVWLYTGRTGAWRAPLARVSSFQVARRVTFRSGMLGECVK